MAARSIALLLLCAGLVYPQQRTTSFRAGTLHLIQGSVSIDGKRVYNKRGITPPVQMRNGQRLHVNSGRVELLLGPGAALTMTEGGTVRMQENQLSDVQLVLEAGAALVKVDQIYKGGRLRVMLPNGAVELPDTGWYRFDAKPQKLRVYRGDAEVALGESLIKVKKGDAVDLAATTPAPDLVSRFNLKDPDALVAWEIQRDKDSELQRYPGVPAYRQPRPPSFDNSSSTSNDQKMPTPTPKPNQQQQFPAQ